MKAVPALGFSKRGTHRVTLHALNNILTYKIQTL